MERDHYIPETRTFSWARMEEGTDSETPFTSEESPVEAFCREISIGALIFLETIDAKLWNALERIGIRWSSNTKLRAKEGDSFENERETEHAFSTPCFELQSAS